MFTNRLLDKEKELCWWISRSKDYYYFFLSDQK